MFKNVHIWLNSYIFQKIKMIIRKSKTNKPIHIMFCVVDHFEPRVGMVSVEKEIERVDNWIEKYSMTIKNHKDYESNKPKYTFFYPIDEYTSQAVEKIVEFCKKGFGEIEVHLHHDKDTSDSLKKKLEYAKQIFFEHGVLSKDKYTQQIKYGFIHGNWALCNSRRDGKWCGVNNELKVLSETGCYADFTLPSAPSETQTKKINSIYYAKGISNRPKSHNTGVDVESGCEYDGELMIVQGPLALNFKKRKFGIIPSIENSEITLNNPPTKNRVDLWVDQKISVKGRPEWIFLKIHTHGANNNNLKKEFFLNLDKMFSYLEDKYNDGVNYKLHYVTAREMFNIIKAAEAGENGEPGQYKDYKLVSMLKNYQESKNENE